MFSKTVKGAHSSALIYSIIETAKANGLAPEKYLLYLFEMIADRDVMDKEMLEKCMPWSDNIPDNLYIKFSK